MIDCGIPMDQDIAECDYFSEIRNSFCQNGIQLRELAQCFANDFKLSLYRRMNEFGARVGLNIMSGKKLLNGCGRSLNVPKVGARHAA